MHNRNASEPLNVLIVYDHLAAGQQGMRLCWQLARLQQGEVEFRPQLWRLDLVSEPDCAGFAITDAVNADLLIISTTSQSELSRAAQLWLRFCLARKRGTSAAMIALLGTDNQVNAADLLNLQLLQSAAKEAGLDFFASFAGCKEAFASVRARGNRAAASESLDQAGPPAARQMAPPHRPAMLPSFNRDTNYRDWGINE